MKLDVSRPARIPDRLDIGPMTSADVSEVARIERASFSTVWPNDAFYNELRTNKLAHYFVGRFHDRIVGYGGIWSILEDAHVTTLAVDPAHRGRRFGEILLLRLIDEAIERNAAWMTLEVRESNTSRSNSIASMVSRPLRCGLATTATITRARSSCGPAI